jgi:hypothetical protein
MRTGGGPGSSGHVAGEHGGSPTRSKFEDLGNVSSLLLSCRNGGDAGVEDTLAELRAGLLGRRRGEERA